MLRVQDIMFPAVLLGCLIVILLTNLVYQPEKVTAAPLPATSAATPQSSGLLANFNLETILEVPTQTIPAAKPTAKAKAKKEIYHANPTASPVLPPAAPSPPATPARLPNGAA